MDSRYPWLRRENEEPSPKLGIFRTGSKGRLWAPGSVPQRRQHRALVEIEEAVLVGADLMDVDVVIAGVDVLLDFLQVLIGVRPADDGLGDRLLVDQFGPLFEVGREGQLEEVVAADAAVGPVFERGLSGRVLRGGPADVQLPVGRLALAALGAESFDRLRFRGGADQPV